MVGEPGGHRGGLLDMRPVRPPQGQGVYRPAEVVAADLTPGHAVVNRPVPREPIALADLAGVTRTMGPQTGDGPGSPGAQAASSG